MISIRFLRIIYVMWAYCEERGKESEQMEQIDWHRTPDIDITSK